MKKRTFFLTSILLLLLAYGIGVIAADARVKRRRLMSVWITAVSAHHKQVVLLSETQKDAVTNPLEPIPTRPPEIDGLANRSNTLIQIEFIVSFCGLAALAVARVRRESGWYWVPILLACIVWMTETILL